MIFFSFVICVAISRPNFVFAETSTDLTGQIQSKKQSISELQRKIDDYNKAIAIKRKEAITLKNQLDLIGNRIEKTQLEIHQTDSEISATKSGLQLLGLAISDKETDIEKRQNWVASLLRSIHRDDQISTLQMVLTKQSVSEMINEKQHIAELQKNIVEGMKELDEAKIKLDAKQKEKEAHKKQLEKFTTQLNGKKEALNSEKSHKNELISETKSSEKKFQTLVDQLKQQARQTESEIFSLEEQQRQKLKKAGKLAELGSFNAIWPVPSHYITAQFHDPDYPFRHIFEHPGIDIRAPQGTAVRAVSAGYVGIAKDAGKGYSYITLIHGGGFATVYGHISSISVKTGAFVEAGDIIGYSGGTPGTRGAGPFVTGAHLHFEIRKDGIPINAESYMP